MPSSRVLLDEKQERVVALEETDVDLRVDPWCHSQAGSVERSPLNLAAEGG